MSFFDTFSQMLVILFAIVVGFAANRLGFLDGPTNQKISQLLLNFTTPALIVASVLTGETLPELAEILSVLKVAALFYGLEGLFVLAVPPLLGGTPGQKGVWRYTLGFPNVGYIGFPVAVALFGQGATFYAAILALPFNLLTFTLGPLLLGGGARFHWKQLVSPCTCASVRALALALTRLRPPALVGEMLGFVGDLTVPLALVLVGSLLAAIPAKRVLGGVRVWVLTALRLLAEPLALWLVLRPMGITPLVMGIAVTQMAMPTAVNGTLLCMACGGDSEAMAQITFMTTLGSIVTIPLVAALLL